MSQGEGSKQSCSAAGAVLNRRADPSIELVSDYSVECRSAERDNGSSWKYLDGHPNISHRIHSDVALLSLLSYPKAK
jgi:hypothetical protein